MLVLSVYNDTPDCKFFRVGFYSLERQITGDVSQQRHKPSFLVPEAEDNGCKIQGRFLNLPQQRLHGIFLNELGLVFEK